MPHAHPAPARHIPLSACIDLCHPNRIAPPTWPIFHVRHGSAERALAPRKGQRAGTLAGTLYRCLRSGSGRRACHVRILYGCAVGLWGGRGGRGTNANNDEPRRIPRRAEYSNPTVRVRSQGVMDYVAGRCLLWGCGSGRLGCIFQTPQSFRKQKYNKDPNACDAASSCFTSTVLLFHTTSPPHVRGLLCRVGQPKACPCIGDCSAAPALRGRWRRSRRAAKRMQQQLRPRRRRRSGRRLPRTLSRRQTPTVPAAWTRRSWSSSSLGYCSARASPSSATPSPSS